MKRNIFVLGAAGLLVILLNSAVFATAKTFFIKGSNIKSLGSAITIDNDNFEFSKTLYVVDSTDPITDFAINSGLVYDAGNPNGREVQIDTNIGESVNVTVWSPGVGAGNYYAKSSLAMSHANFENSTLTWNWDNMAVDYKAAPPYKPGITSFAESTTSYTNDNPSVSTLTVSSNRGSGSDGLREVTTHAWKMWLASDPEPTEPLAGKTSATLSLDSDEVASGVTYAFKVADSNMWGGPTWSDTYTYTVAGGPAAADLLSIALTKYANGFGVNDFGIPYVTNYDSASNPVTNLQQLINAINNAADEGYATTIGFWDGAQEVGFTLNETGGVIDKVNTDLNPEDISLVRGRGYQCSVTEDRTLVIKNTP
jgi:hypothetical protein